MPRKWIWREIQKRAAVEGISPELYALRRNLVFLRRKYRETGRAWFEEQLLACGRALRAEEAK